ncbi:MAG: iron-containing alcohol dehydrogenase [Deltaproteobacteria bacterium]|nr:MAG: iron-containing alcohol dehydrogenase [Deltaproteobacteria bacterium]
MVDSFKFHLPTRVHFGEKIIETAGKKSRRFGSRALMVSGAMGKNSGALQKVTGSFEKAGIETVVFDEVEAQPRVKTIESGARVARDTKCEMVVGIGGECPMDAAKVMALLAKDTSPLEYYFGAHEIKNPPLPIIAVPLTAGSGSEVTPFAAITTTNDFLDIQAVVSPFIYPNAAFVDPQFTLSFPATVTINNGIDAFSHCIEGYLAKSSQPLTDSLALEAIRIIKNYLPTVLEDPHNLKYRAKMSYASLLGGIVNAQTGIGLVHRMGWHLTLNSGAAHGAANGLLLPWACEFVLNRAHKKMAGLATALNDNLEGPGEEESVEGVVESIKEFIFQTGSVPGLNKEELTDEKIKVISKRTLKNKAAIKENWGDINLKNIESIYHKALQFQISI